MGLVDLDVRAVPEPAQQQQQRHTHTAGTAGGSAVRQHTGQHSTQVKHHTQVNKTHSKQADSLLWVCSPRGAAVCIDDGLLAVPLHAGGPAPAGCQVVVHQLALVTLEACRRHHRQVEHTNTNTQEMSGGQTRTSSASILLLCGLLHPANATQRVDTSHIMNALPAAAAVVLL